MFTSTFRRSVFVPRSFPSRQAFPARQFQTTSIRCAKKGAEDKDSISTESTEYSKSGGDGAAAGASDEAAFSADKTRPEEEHASAGQETGGDQNNPLNVSPANPDVSRTSGANKSGATGSKSETGEGSERARTSGGGSPTKSGGGKSG